MPAQGCRHGTLSGHSHNPSSARRAVGASPPSLGFHTRGPRSAAPSPGQPQPLRPQKQTCPLRAAGMAPWAGIVTIRRSLRPGGPLAPRRPASGFIPVAGVNTAVLVLSVMFPQDWGLGRRNPTS